MPLACRLPLRASHSRLIDAYHHLCTEPVPIAATPSATPEQAAAHNAAATAAFNAWKGAARGDGGTVHLFDSVAAAAVAAQGASLAPPVAAVLELEPLQEEEGERLSKAQRRRRRKQGGGELPRAAAADADERAPEQGSAAASEQLAGGGVSEEDKLRKARAVASLGEPAWEGGGIGAVVAGPPPCSW